MRLDKHTTKRIEDVLDKDTDTRKDFNRLIDTIIIDLDQSGYDYEDIRDYILDIVENKLNDEFPDQAYIVFKRIFNQLKKLI